MNELNNTQLKQQALGQTPSAALTNQKEDHLCQIQTGPFLAGPQNRSNKTPNTHRFEHAGHLPNRIEARGRRVQIHLPGAAHDGEQQPGGLEVPNLGCRHRRPGGRGAGGWGEFNSSCRGQNQSTPNCPSLLGLPKTAVPFGLRSSDWLNVVISNDSCIG